MLARWFLLALAVAAGTARGQLPKSASLSESDQLLFHAEIDRLEKLLTRAVDRGTVTYQLARTWAAAKQWPEALEWLRKAIELRAGFDPSRDPIFRDIRETQEFEPIRAAARAATPPVSSSRPGFKVGEGDLAPESIAYDPRDRRFYFGSMRKGKIVRCSDSGDCAPFARGLGTVLGLKVHGNGLWALNNRDKESALIHYDLPSGRMIRVYRVTGAGHNFNDLTITQGGDIYLTDTAAGAVWYLANGGDLKKLAGQFKFANGITVSADARTLYVSTFPDGVTVVDLKRMLAAPLRHSADLCLANIDGLYFYKGALVAIQNGFMTPRVVRLTLTRDLRGVDRLEVLERRNPLFEGITTGVVVGNRFFYVGNVQDEDKPAYQPIVVLTIQL